MNDINKGLYYQLFVREYTSPQAYAVAGLVIVAEILFIVGCIL